MAVRELRVFGDPVLRRPCRAVGAVDERVLALLEDLCDTLHQFPNGAGLAAPQVGILKRLVVIDYGRGPLYLVDPVLESATGTQECTEGCLSLPGRFGVTRRPRFVTVRYRDERGAKRVIRAEGELAKCLCHELDHLDGVLFTDHLVRWLP